MALEHPRLQVVKGDVTELADVERVIAGQDVILFTVGIKPTRDPVSVFSVGTRNVLSAMQGNPSQRLVLVTGIGAGDSRGHGGFFYDRILQPFVLKTMYEDKDRSEALLRASTVDWTIVRPGFLTDSVSAANYRVIRQMEGVTSGDISRADVAHYLLSQSESGSQRADTVFLSD